jgi:tetratricopeptide (TPR) repeat protein
MCVRGISLSCLGREEEAITWYSKGLEVKPDDLRLLRLRSEAFARLKNADKAREDLKRIEEFYPNDKLNQIHASRVLKLLGLQKESQQTLAKADLARGNEDSYDDYLRDLTRLVLEEFKPEKEIFFRQKLEAEEAFQDFLNLGDPSTRLQPFHESRIFFMGLRKWNSFTPSLPSAGEDSVGGGYFLFYKGTGTVIDPGFNFLRNFYKAGGRLNHIHNVVITHAHNDHTNDLEIILSHLHQRNEKLKRLKKGSNGTKWQNDDHRVDLYLNLGAFIKYSGYLDLRTEYVRDIRVINTGEEYSLAEGLRLRVLPAYHDEVVSQKYSVGLHFSLDLGKEIKKHVVFTGDSGLCKTEPGDGGEAMVGLEEVIWKKYFPGTEPPPIDLLVVHLGSIKPNELDEEKLDRLADALDQKIGRIRKDDSPFYHNHLGIHGVVTLITNLKPKLALISEFGEELKSFLPSLMKIIATCVEQLTLIPDGTPKPVVAPCALFLLYDLETDKICSVISKKFEPIKTIKYKWVDKGSTGPEGPLIFFNPNDSGDTDRWLGGIEWLMESMKTGKGIFAEPQ